MDKSKKSNFSGNLKKLFVLKASLKDVFDKAFRRLVETS